MSGAIYLIQDGGHLLAMTESAYSSEDLLQSYLATHPNLLAGEQMNSADPRRWLLVQREAALPFEEGGSGRWSVDHLFLDQDGIPTIVEVKRSSDSRIRREVVGQMLDYAANAVAYWPVEEIRTRFEATCAASGQDSDEELADLLASSESDPDQFWQVVKVNLQAGRVRLVFVADSIPPELRRVIEFLNQQMDPAEVLGVEIKQYSDPSILDGPTALVPRIIGQTQQAVVKKSGHAVTSQWDEATVLARFEERSGPIVLAIVQRFLEWARARSLPLGWHHGYRPRKPCIVVRAAPHHKAWLVSLWPSGAVGGSGVVNVEFRRMKALPPFDAEAARLDWCRRLNSVPGVTIPEAKIDAWPSVSLSVLEDPAVLEQFLTELGWAVDEVGQT